MARRIATGLLIVAIALSAFSAPTRGQWTEVDNPGDLTVQLTTGEHIPVPESAQICLTPEGGDPTCETIAEGRNVYDDPPHEPITISFEGIDGFFPVSWEMTIPPDGALVDVKLSTIGNGPHPSVAKVSWATANPSGHDVTYQVISTGAGEPGIVLNLEDQFGELVDIDTGQIECVELVDGTPCEVAPLSPGGLKVTSAASADGSFNLQLLYHAHIDGTPGTVVTNNACAWQGVDAEHVCTSISLPVLEAASTFVPEPTPTPNPSPTAIPSPTPEPSPGSIRVTADETEDGPISVSSDARIAIIFDTSGSMLQAFEDSTRAAVAKSALTNLLTETIPAGTTVSLRAFGATPDSCDSSLAIPRGPLDPTTVEPVIANLPVIDGVRTPIGAALQAVVDDLGPGDGPAVVVLVTDGEETCNGDPAAAIEALVALGIDVHVNIVGFALEDQALRDQFSSWAALGNGRYIDAGSSADLSAAIAEAVHPTFEVIADDGSVIATGQVGGDAVSVPPGTYTVIIRSNPEATIPDVTVRSGEDIALEP